jgi:uncharacterized protein (TIGR02246 family)
MRPVKYEPESRMTETVQALPEASSTTMTTPDATTIAANLVEQLERAWNRADGAAFADVFTQDTDFVDVRAAHHSGVEAVARGHQALFDSIYAGSTVTYQLETAREVAPGCIVAVVAATLNVPSGPMQGVNQARFTAVMTELEGSWSVAAFQNTLVPRDR